MQGMMERTRQAVALLKDRITVTQTELERREVGTSPTSQGTRGD